MKKTLNVYEQQLIAQGRDLPKAQPCTGKVPARFADRFATFEEYQEAMADFLNGMEGNRKFRHFLQKSNDRHSSKRSLER
jgi:hypothetical protein